MTFVFDDEQQNLLREIHRHRELICDGSTREAVLSLLRPFSHRAGLYVYGPVGRGKTTLMQHVYDEIQSTKQRYHCDTFLAELHRALQTNSIELLVRDIRKKGHVLWIDELQIYDIATAMLLRKLIPALIKQHVIILMTGNVSPEDFYKGGLNREQFKDFIPYFLEHFYCFPLDGTVDYRLQSKPEHIPNNARNTHFWLSSPSTTAAMEAVFTTLARNQASAPFILELSHREWILAKTVPSLVFIDFSLLAECDHAFDDYRTLVQAFPIIFVTDVPIFDQTNRDACRRFMAFIDIVYDNGAELYMSAHASPAELYQDPGNTLPFGRTASRLGEMM